MRFKHYIYTILSFILPITAYADHCGGKVDFGPVYVHLDVLHSGHTIKKLDLAGFKLNGTIMLKTGSGFCIKPDVIYAQGHGELFAGSFGFGHVTPINDKFCVTPTIGVTLTNLRTSISPRIPQLNFQRVHLKERFRSLAPFIGLDMHYNIYEGYRICGSIQYAWSHTHTRIQKEGKFKGDSQGASYAVMLEKDLSKEWSVHIGAAYNLALSHEKHGLRGYGFKLGIARWF
jgi:hypothetical protein